MTVSSSQPNNRPASSTEAESTLLVDMATEGDTCVVRVTGELDRAARDQLVSESASGDHPAMVIDLGGVTFMDCSGFGSLIASQLANGGEARSLTIIGQTGQPARLLELLAELENGWSDET